MPRQVIAAILGHPQVGGQSKVGWPHFRRVGELGSSSTVLLFIRRWAEIAQSRMAALPIVEYFDVLKNRQLRLLTSPIAVPVGPLAFERTEEGFHRRIVVAIAFAAHADLDPELGQ